AQWTSTGNAEYTLGTIDKKNTGTDIIIILKDDTFSDSFKIKNIISQYFSHNPISIYFNEIKDEKPTEPTKLNDEFSIFKTPNDKITNKQYNDLYSKTFYDYSEPLLISNTTKELMHLTMKVVLFFPRNKPFDLNNADTNNPNNIKLYVNNTFINNKSALTGRAFRWVKGIISCDNIQLNMSRENMQNNDAHVPMIQKTLDKTIINEISKLKTKDAEKYQQITTTFNSILKEGLCQPNYNKDLMKIISFTTLDNQNQTNTSTLNEYIEEQNKNHKESDKKEIYYLLAAATDVNNLQQQNKHHIRRFQSMVPNKKIILLYDSVDFFWTKFITEHQEYKLISIQSIESNDTEKHEKDNDQFIKFIKDELKEHIDKVKINNSNEYPIQLQGNATNDNIVNQITGNNQSNIKNSIEINLQHPLIQKIKEKNDKKTLHTLHNIALILEGQQPINRTDFANHILNTV
ncbi:MAG: hypothetical protein AAFO15_02330, partial [Pseudomonadota bacterium]